MQPWLDSARAHAPLLMIVAPLAAAALALLAPGGRLAWAVACLGGAVAATIALDLALRMFVFGAVQPHAAEGAALEPGGASVACAALLTVAAFVAMLASRAMLRHDVRTRAGPMTMALLSVALAGWIGALFARDLAAIFLAVETAWLAVVALLALAGERARGAVSAALRMLIAGGVAAALMLLGVGLVERGVAGARLEALSSITVATPRLAGVGAGLIIVALALKAGLAPLHGWIGAAYGRASPGVALILGVVGAGGALSVLMRVSAAAIGAPEVGDGVAAALAVLATVTVVIGSIQAVGARNVRRLAAYAGAAQAGCALVGVALGSPAGLAAALVQTLALLAAMLALLGGATAIDGDAPLSALDGLSRRAPIASAAMTFALLSLMGAPLTTGFLARWRLIEAGLGAGWWWSAAVMIGGSLAAVVYGGRMIERLYFRRATHAVEHGDRWRWARAPALLLAVLALAWGVEPSLLLRAADAASQLDLGEGS
ncbi:MAG TPA: proton-conducting transporter membrane subunit [Caulobacterales bacterium]|nr:proton-conducting transporter membrane subunit [Caulobacterales bacterium]